MDKLYVFILQIKIELEMVSLIYFARLFTQISINYKYFYTNTFMQKLKICMVENGREVLAKLYFCDKRGLRDKLKLLYFKKIIFCSQFALSYSIFRQFHLKLVLFLVKFFKVCHFCY